MRSLEAIDKDLTEVEAELFAESASLTIDHGRVVELHERAARLWQERAAALGGV